MAALSHEATAARWPAVAVGEPDVFGPLAVFPLLAERAAFPRYLTLAVALERGARVAEVPTSARMDALVVDNPLAVPVLVYEGEGIVGERQNRVFATSVLVPERTALTVPVACVEEGRWGRSHSGPAERAAHAAPPALRRLMSDAVRARLRAGQEPGTDQTAVWSDISARMARHRVASSTRALDDLYTAHRRELHAAARAIELREGQVGALVASGGRFVVLDHVSAPSAWYRLKHALVLGYALGALEDDVVAAPTVADAGAFVDRVWTAPRVRSRGVGLGEIVCFDAGDLTGTGITWNGAITTLTAFADG